MAGAAEEPETAVAGLSAASERGQRPPHSLGCD